MKDKNIKNTLFNKVWITCIVLLSTLCMYGLLTQTKSTYSASMISGKWEFNDCMNYDIFPTENLSSKTVNVNFTSAGSSFKKMSFQTSYAGGNIYMISYDSTGQFYYNDNGTGSEAIWRENNPPSVANDKICYYFHMAVDVGTLVKPSQLPTSTVDFGATPQSVDTDFYNWFTTNATQLNACYLESNGKYVWTNASDGVIVSDIIDKSACENKNTVSATFYPNGGTFSDGTTTTKIMYVHKETSIDLPKISRTDADFYGWSSVSSSYVSVVDPFRFGANAIDRSFYAFWKYKVTYNANGGTIDGGFTKEQYVVSGDTYSSLPIPVKEGYTFLGWYDSAIGGTEVYEHYMPDKNITLYARWENNFEVDSLYAVDEVNKYIIFNKETTEDEFKSNVTLATGYSITSETKKIDKKDMLYTSGKIKILKSDNSVYNEYTTIVLGDTNGDGTISMVDYMYIYEHKSTEYERELTGIYLLAADFDQSDLVNMVDYMNIYEYVKAQQ